MFNLKFKNSFQFYILCFISLGILIGFLSITHLQSSLIRKTDSLQSDKELQKTASNLEKEQKDLKNKINNLEKKISLNQENLKKTESISLENAEQLKKVKEEVGLTSVEGKGVIINLADSQQIKNGNIESFLIHASDLRDIVNLLWLAKAKAISINNERIIFSSSIDCLGNTIMVNNTNLGSPYKISAVVNQDELKSLLDNDNYLKYFKERVNKNNLIFNIENKDKVEIPAYSGALIFNYLN